MLWLEGLHYRKEPDGCWRWLGNYYAGGYGHTGGREGKGAHVAAYEDNVGPIPEGFVVHHKCEHKYCVNWIDCLQPLTESQHRYAHFGTTKCPNGHEYTPENVYTVTRHNRRRADGTSTIGRMCRRCHLDKTNLRRRRARNAVFSL